MSDEVKKLAEAEAQRLLALLSAHYGEPVMPVSRYCGAFETWVRAVAEESRAADKEGKTHELKHLVEHFVNFRLAITKSNLLARLIYRGQKLRTKKCPVHKGRWSGCSFGPETDCKHCMDLGNITGWLPEPDGNDG